jgi:hypothetical protein
MACSCQKKRKYIGMARRKKQNLTSLLTDVGLGTAGYIAGEYLNKVSFIQENPNLAGVAKTAVGLGAAMFVKEPMAKTFGVGMAISGATQLVKEVVPGVGASAIIRGLPARVSTSVHAVSGNGYERQAAPFASMQ